MGCGMTAITNNMGSCGMTAGRPNGGVMPTQILCGTYRVSESTVYHYAGYECAAWWRDVRVEAGEYPVSVYLDGSTLRFSVKLPGVLVADNFQSLFCGNAIGKGYDETQNAGKPDSYSIHSQDYCVFASLKAGNNSPWRIDLSLLPIALDSCLDCGSVITKRPAVTRCPSCSVERSQERRNSACRRHRFLLATGYGLRTTRESSYLDSVIAEANADQGFMVDFYGKILREEIAAMRTVGPQGRVAARQRYPVPEYAFPAR
jgi:hypothetical protein